MFRKFAVGATIVAAALAVGAPMAAAAPVSAKQIGVTEVVFGGVYPTFAAAQKACNDGIAQGRWWGCSYQTPAATFPVTYLWVQV